MLLEGVWKGKGDRDWKSPT